jgi:hypothetical protein
MAKPSRSQSARSARPADARILETALQWPQPPHYETIDDAEEPRAEPAVALLRDGRKLTGMLTRFDPAEGLFEMRPDDGELTEISPHDLLELRLTRSVNLRRRRSVISEGIDQETPPERQLFRLTLANDQVVEGDTLGFDTHTLGLFLYVDGNGEGVTRLFVPTDAIKRKQIGRRLGDLLVSDQTVTPRQITEAIEQQAARRRRKLGDYLTREQVISRTDLAAAIERQRQMPVMRLGEALVAMNLISENQLDDALSRQKEHRGKPLGEILVELGLVSREDLKRTLTQQLGIPFVDLTRYEVEAPVLKLVPAAVAAEYNVLPLCIDGRALVLAVENPLDPIPLDRIRFLSGMPIAPVMAAAGELRDAIRQHYGHERRADSEDRGPCCRARHRGIDPARRRRAGTRDRQRTRAPRQQDRARRARSKGVGHPHRVLSRPPAGARALSPGRQPARVPHVALNLPGGAAVARQDHGEPRHLGKAPCAGRQDPVPEFRPGEARAAPGDDPDD